jgi:hypothetical protein
MRSHNSNQRSTSQDQKLPDFTRYIEGDATEPELQFTGTANPAVKHLLLESGQIDLADFGLLAIIDGYTSMRGLGCWASHALLAKWMGYKSRAQVCRRLAKLRKLGVVKQTGWLTCQGQRRQVLVTDYLAGQRAVRGGAQRAVRGGAHNVIHNPSNDRSSTTLAKKGGTSMPFYLDRVKSSPTGVDANLAKRWRDANLENNRIKAGTWNLAKWTDSFRLLRKRLGEEEVRRLAEWYCNHVDKPLFIVNPEHLLRGGRLLPWLQDLVNKHYRDNPDVAISEDAARIADRLKRSYRWPKGSAERLPIAVQNGLDNYRTFRAAIKGSFKDPKVQKFAVWLADGGTPSAIPFVEKWMERLFKSWAGNDKWSASLTAITFRTDSKSFREIGCGWARGRGGPEVWDSLMEAIR